jgi:hypothetical protein
MSTTKKHEFFDFTHSVKGWLAQEYERIQARVHEDPGTAGDQAEENWATLLRNWLPATYPIVTKGRLIDDKGRASPQVDILVLAPSYPLALRDKKLFFAGGVIAAFECKLTLQPAHLKKALANSAFIKNMVAIRQGNPFDELHQPIIYGLLAHSHDWKASGRHAMFKIANTLHRYVEKCGLIDPPQVTHPRDLLDFVCVADVAMFTMKHTIHMGPTIDQQRIDAFGDDPEGGLESYYEAHWETKEDPYDSRGDLLGALIYELTTLMAYQDPSLRNFADYLCMVGVWGGIGAIHKWSPSVFSTEVATKLAESGPHEGPWSRWSRNL